MPAAVQSSASVIAPSVAKYSFKFMSADSVPLATALQVAKAPGPFATVRSMGFRVSPQVNEERAAFLTRIVDECFAGKNAALGRRLGYADGSFIGQMRRLEKPISESIFEKLLAIPEAKRLIPRPSGSGFHGVAHDLSELSPIVNPQTIEWGVVMSGFLPPVFALSVKDEAMSPFLSVGDIVRFAADREPVAGRPVLLKDKDGNAYIRDYMPRRAGVWTASARNPGFLPMDSEADGLTVVAVMTGMDWDF
jgi:hypothetical protein